MKKAKKAALRGERKRSTAPLEQAAAAGRAMAHELPAEMLAVLLERGGEDFYFDAAVKARAGSQRGLDADERQVAMEAATADVAFTMGISCGLALAGAANTGVPPLLLDAFRAHHRRAAKTKRGRR